MDQIASRDTTFDNIKPETMWISFSNVKKKGYLTVDLSINGIEKELTSFYINGLSPSEGMTLESCNLSWVFNKLKIENDNCSQQHESKD